MGRKLAALMGIAALGLGGLASFVAFEPSPAQAREAVIYKSPTCGCCKGWATYLQRNGYKVTVIDREDMDRVKDELGVPDSLRSCHTAKIGAAVVEGHVPLEAIERFLAERPQAKGLASPGMPSGSPGMDGPKVPNTIYTFGASDPKQFGSY
ncbi:MAG: DUF411 domain-containing protein [Magnetospirillum sp.]|nr:DUF411 domain-containing protein [Magnetospirillum sp.]